MCIRDSPTLGASPVANALTLVRALPKGARLHLAAHSRGGLVAEVLARVAAQPRLTADDLAFFAGAGLAVLAGRFTPALRARAGRHLLRLAVATDKTAFLVVRHGDEAVAERRRVEHERDALGGHDLDRGGGDFGL